MTDVSLSRAVGKSDSYINRVATGKMKPPYEVIEQIALKLDTTPAFLLGLNADQRPVLSLHKTKDLLIHGLMHRPTVFIGYNCADFDAVPQVGTPWLHSKFSFAVLMEDDTMEAGRGGYPEHSLVFFEPLDHESEINLNGKDLLFFKDGEVTFRRMQSEYMKPLNAQYPVLSRTGWQPRAIAVASMTLTPLPQEIADFYLR